MLGGVNFGTFFAWVLLGVELLGAVRQECILEDNFGECMKSAGPPDFWSEYRRSAGLPWIGAIAWENSCRSLDF